MLVSTCYMLLASYYQLFFTCNFLFAPFYCLATFYLLPFVTCVFFFLFATFNFLLSFYYFLLFTGYLLVSTCCLLFATFHFVGLKDKQDGLQSFCVLAKLEIWFGFTCYLLLATKYLLLASCRLSLATRYILFANWYLESMHILCNQLLPNFRAPPPPRVIKIIIGLTI